MIMSDQLSIGHIFCTKYMYVVKKVEEYAVNSVPLATVLVPT
jgi:hypothetical protein